MKIKSSDKNRIEDEDEDMIIGPTSPKCSSLVGSYHPQAARLLDLGAVRVSPSRQFRATAGLAARGLTISVSAVARQQQLPPK